MFKKNTFWLVVLTLAIAISLPAYLAASETENLIQNGSFETYAKDPGVWSVAGAIDFDLDVDNTDITGWTVINGKIDYVQESAYTWKAADGKRSLDLCGTPGSGGVSQTFATIADQMYKVQFSMSANPTTGWSGEDMPNKTVSAQAAGQSADFAFDIVTEQSSTEDMKWKLCTFTFVADSDSATLEIFSTMEIVKIGPVIDNVSVAPVTVFSPAGTYLGTDEPWGEKILLTVIPLDQDSQRFSIVSDVINTANKSRIMARGELVRTGPNTFDGTQVSYMTDENFELTSKVVVSGTIVQTSTDSLEAAWIAAVYGGNQDPFAEGAVPLVSFPATAWYQRVPIVPPYLPPTAP